MSDVTEQDKSLFTKDMFLLLSLFFFGMSLTFGVD